MRGEAVALLVGKDSEAASVDELRELGRRLDWSELECGVRLQKRGGDILVFLGLHAAGRVEEASAGGPSTRGRPEEGELRAGEPEKRFRRQTMSDLGVFAQPSRYRP